MITIYSFLIISLDHNFMESTKNEPWRANVAKVNCCETLSYIPIYLLRVKDTARYQYTLLLSGKVDTANFCSAKLWRPQTFVVCLKKLILQNFLMRKRILKIKLWRAMWLKSTPVKHWTISPCTYSNSMTLQDTSTHLCCLKNWTLQIFVVSKSTDFYNEKRGDYKFL